MQYVVLMDGRVVPLPDGSPMPAGARPAGNIPFFSSGTQQPIVTSYGNTGIMGTNQPAQRALANPYGFATYLENAGILGEGGAQQLTNIFESMRPGYTDQYGIGSAQERFGRTGLFGMPLTQPADEGALNFVQTTDPNAPFYVRPPESYFNLDFGGEGLFGMSGDRAFTQFDIGMGDLERFNRDLATMDYPGKPVEINPVNDAVLKNLSLGRTGNQTMFKDDRPTGTRDTYLSPEEMGTRLGIDVSKATDQESLIKTIENKLRKDANANSRYTKTNILVNEATTGGEKPVRETINLGDVGKLYKENIIEQEKANLEIENAKRVAGVGLENKIKNIFSDPYDEYVASVPEGETVLSRKAYETQANELLKENNLDVATTAEKASTFSPNDFYNLVGMYYQLGGLLADERQAPKLVSMSASPGLRLEEEDLYKNRRI